MQEYPKEFLDFMLKNYPGCGHEQMKINYALWQKPSLKEMEEMEKNNMRLNPFAKMFYLGKPIYVLKKYKQVIIPKSFSIDIYPGNNDNAGRIMVETDGCGTIPLEDLRFVNEGDEEWMKTDFPHIFENMEAVTTMRISLKF